MNVKLLATVMFEYVADTESYDGEVSALNIAHLEQEEMGWEVGLIMDALSIGEVRHISVVPAEE